MGRIRGSFMHTCIDMSIPLTVHRVDEIDFETYGYHALDAANPRAWIPLEIIFQREKRKATPRAFRQWFASLFEADLTDFEREAKHHRFLSNLLHGPYTWLCFLACCIEKLDDKELCTYAAFLGLPSTIPVDTSPTALAVHRAALQEDIMEATSNVKYIFHCAMRSEDTEDTATEDWAVDPRVHIMRLVTLAVTKTLRDDETPKQLINRFDRLCHQGFFSCFVDSAADSIQESFVPQLLHVLEPCLHIHASHSCLTFHHVLQRKPCLSKKESSFVNCGENPLVESTTLPA